jgi:hypothetical protein
MHKSFTCPVGARERCGSGERTSRRRTVWSAVALAQVARLGRLASLHSRTPGVRARGGGVRAFSCIEYERSKRVTRPTGSS